MLLLCNVSTLCHTSLGKTFGQRYGLTLCHPYVVGRPYVGLTLCLVGILSLNQRFLASSRLQH